MAPGIGEGAELQAPWREPTGGLTASTMVTLVLVPSAKTLFEEESKACRGRRIRLRAPKTHI
jgi:hypothetical protein